MSTDQSQTANTDIAILLVDDRPESLLALHASLENEPYSLISVSSGQEALLQILDRDFAAVVLDVQMPVVDGFEVAELIRARERSQHTPIIFLTAAYQTDEDALRAYRLGAADYVVKPVIPEILRSKVAAFVNLNRLHRELELRLAETRRLNHESEEANRALAQSEAKLLELNASLEQRVVERTAALKVAEQKFRFLTEAGGELASSLDQAETVETIARLVVPRLADWCLLELVQDDGSIRRAAALHVDSEKTKYVLQLDLRLFTGPNSSEPFSFVVDNTAPVPLPKLELGSIQQDETTDKQLELLSQVGMQWGMVLTMQARGRALGTLLIGAADSARVYSQSDMALVQEFVSRAALALDNGRLYDDSLAAIRARDHFLAVASHELKTPLTVISGYAELLRRQVEESNRGGGDEGGLVPQAFDTYKWHRQVVKMQDASQRLTHLINDLLDINRLQTRSLELSLELFDLVELASQVVQNFVVREQSLHRSTQINFRPSPREIWGMWDKGRLEQVIVNLMDNAVKYSVGTGAVDVELDVERTAGGPNQVALLVRDYGIGIPPEDLTKVFDSFTRASNALEQHFSGLGLGLAITQRIVERHGGSIAVSSPGLNQGSTFRVILPLAEVDYSEPSQLREPRLDHDLFPIPE